MKQSEKNLSVIENFILHLTTNTYGDVDGNVPFTITANELYKSASEYIEEDHVDGKGNPEDEETIVLLADLFEQADEDVPQEYRSEAFTDTLKEVEAVLVKFGKRKY